MIIIGFVGGGILLCVIVGIILSALMDAKDKKDISNIIEKRKELVNSIGEFEGKSLKEIKDNLGEPSNVDISNDKRIITWQALGLKIMCSNQDPIVCEEVLVNRFGNK